MPKSLNKKVSAHPTKYSEKFYRELETFVDVEEAAKYLGVVPSPQFFLANVSNILVEF